MKPIQFMVALMLAFFSITSCQEDPCDNLLCVNGGICNEGKCDCPEGFGGSNCNEHLAPLSMRISFVTLTRYPATKDGISWDETNGPDMFFKLYEDTFPIGKPLDLILDAAADQLFQFPISVIEMRNITTKHVMKLWDYEGFNLPPEYMGEVEFIPFHEESGRPDTLVLDIGGAVAFMIGVTYHYPDASDDVSD